MLNYYQFMVVRLNGDEIRKRFAHYRSLVRKGIAGFILFGGELETVRVYARKLQDEAEIPLMIASDLERGLGQQLKGGTFFPPAMALAAAYKKGTRDKGRVAGLRLIRRSFMAVAEEAAYAGINTIFAPVLDINTNPDNPIIAARAFGEDPETVSLFGAEMIQALQKSGIAACGKHFPGHGDTAVDSHIQLPVLKQGLRRLLQFELRPFQRAVAEGVRMLMMGHLSVPAIDPSGTPASFSRRAVQFIRRGMGYDGLLVTDALNMGGMGRYSEEEASRLALEAGVDVLLHPSDPQRLAAYLRREMVSAAPGRLLTFRTGLDRLQDSETPLFSSHQQLSERLTADAITVTKKVKTNGVPLLVMLNDEKEEKGEIFAHLMQAQFPEMRVFRLSPGSVPGRVRRKEGECMIIAIFSETKAWKGGASSWLSGKLASLRARADLCISFGSPYLLRGLGNVPCMPVFWDAEQAQKSAAEVVKNLWHLPGRNTRSI